MYRNSVKVWAPQLIVVGGEAARYNPDSWVGHWAKCGFFEVPVCIYLTDKHDEWVHFTFAQYGLKSVLRAF